MVDWTGEDPVDFGRKGVIAAKARVYRLACATTLAAVARERSNVISIEHDRLPPECPPGYSAVILLLETRDRAHGKDLSARLEERGFRSTS